MTGRARRAARQAKVEAQLRRIATYLVRGQEITHTGSWAWNPHSRSLFWSPEHFRILGLDPQRTQPSYELFFRMIHADDRAGVEASFAEAIRSKSDYEGEFRVVRRDGATRHIHSMAQPIFDQTGALVEYVGTFIDVTERTLAEGALRRTHLKVWEMARSMSVGRLAAWTAHEINQPLAAVVANGNAALRWLEGTNFRIDKAQEALRSIVRDGKRASDVIGQIRAFVARSDTARESLQLNIVVHEAACLIGTDPRSNSVNVREQLADELPYISGSRIQLQQVLLNLMVNGMEAMEGIARTRELVVSTCSQDGRAEVAVRDCGVGILEENLERVFEDFYTTKPRGMGIGLSISRDIIEEHGGRLWATRNAGPGATFIFSLPGCSR